MRQIFSRVPGYTIVELLVVLILSSILTGAVLLIYSSTVSYSISLDRKLENVKGIDLLLNEMRKDFELSKTTSYSEGTIICEFNGRKRVIYRFTAEMIFRKQLDRVDSLYCNLEFVNFKFNGLSVQAGMVDELDARLTYSGRLLNLRIRKDYDRATLLLKSDSTVWSKN